MGYYANSEQSDFFIRHGNFEDILESLHAKWSEYSKEDDLPEVMTDFGFTVEIDKHGNIVEMYYEYNKFHSDEIEKVFDMLAPFVEPGSYITFRGEDDNLWAYYFNGAKCVEYQGKTIFPGMPMGGPVMPRHKVDLAGQHDR